VGQLYSESRVLHNRVIHNETIIENLCDATAVAADHVNTIRTRLDTRLMKVEMALNSLLEHCRRGTVNDETAAAMQKQDFERRELHDVRGLVNYVEFNSEWALPSESLWQPYVLPTVPTAAPPSRKARYAGPVEDPSARSTGLRSQKREREDTSAPADLPPPSSLPQASLVIPRDPSWTTDRYKDASVTSFPLITAAGTAAIAAEITRGAKAEAAPGSKLLRLYKLFQLYKLLQFKDNLLPEPGGEGRTRDGRRPDP
jgi:hypothetical protein